MLNKIIATVLGCALLVNTSMIASANESDAENTIPDETALATNTNGVNESGSTDEHAEPMESASQADIGAAVRKNLNVHVMDVIYFQDGVRLTDSKNNWKVAKSGEKIYLVGIDDWNQRFRVFVPRLNDGENTTVYYLNYADVDDALLDDSHVGIVVGDLDFDGCVDIFDMALMRRGYVYGWDNNLTYLMADMNADGEVSIVDLIWLQRWLLGIIK